MRPNGVLAALLGAAFALGCAGDGDTQQDCSLAARNAYVYELMRDIYLWADEVPELDPAGFESPSALLDAMAYRSVDRWSGIQPAAERNEYFEEARYVGLGFQLVTTERGLRVALVYRGSPAELAGIRRGDMVLGINGKSVEDIEREGSWGTIDGPTAPGVEVDYELADSTGARRQVVLRKDWIAIQTVLESRVIPTDTGRVGYLLFTSFLSTAPEELRAAFATFRAENVTDLVLDLRYNGGGLINVAGILASLILDADEAGSVLSQFEFNRKHLDDNGVLELRKEPSALGLERLFVLTGAGTASASELLVNGLEPYIPVTLVGSVTHGKPVGANTWEHCGQAITPITFRILNSEAEGDYFDGLRPACAARDDLDHELGSPDESRLSAALGLVRTGKCIPELARRLPTAHALGERLIKRSADDLRPF
jgi:carboxyl-terminal processing protease